MTARCHCGRPVPESSACGCHCAEHDDPASKWTPAMLLTVIDRALKAGDMEAVAIALRVLAVKSPDDAQTIVDALDLAGGTE